MISFNSIKQVSCLCLICLLVFNAIIILKQENNTPAVQLNTVNNIRIAYVNSDTVSKYYDFAALIQTKLLNKEVLPKIS